MKNKKLQNFTNILSNIFLLCLWALAFQSIFWQAIFWFEMASYALSSVILNLIQNLQYMIVILAIVSGSLIIYVNREEVESVEKEKEKDSKYVWYKYIFLLIVIVLFWFGLRYYNLWTILPFSDEYTHLANVKMLYEWIFIEDDRGIFINHLIKFLYDYFWYDINLFFEQSEYWLFLARIPWVVIWSLTIVLFYFIWKELISRKFGLLLAFLLAISPMNIEMSKFIREYIYFYFLLSLYLLLFLKINLNKITSKNNIIFIFYTFLLIVFSFFIEPLSTLKVIVFFIFVWFILFWIIHIEKLKNIKEHKNWFIISILILWWVLALFYSKFSVFLWINVNYTWLDFFITNTRNYPSWLDNIKYLSLLLILLWFYYILKNKLINNHKFIYIFSLFTIFIIFYVYLFDRYIQIRYAYYVFIPFIILLWLWLYFLFKTPFNKKIIYILLFFCIFSINSTLYSLNWYKYWTWNKITDHYIEKYNWIYNIINKDLNKDETIIITSFTHAAYLSWFKYNNILLYKSKDKNRFKFIDESIYNNKKWYIILDWRRNWFWSKWLPKKDFTSWWKDVKLIWNIDGIFLYKF